MFSQWQPRRQSGRRVMEQGTITSDDMEHNILNINTEIPMFTIYRLSMELQDPEQLLQTVIDVIKYASCGISPDRLMVSPELWEWIKTEIDKYNEHEKRN